MVRLEIGQAEDARHRPGELAEAVVDELRHQRHARLELVAVDLGAVADPRALPPWPRHRRIEWPARPELALRERLDRSGHVRVVWRTGPLEDPRQAGRVRQRPA